jgi:TetR/AcrR family transcriptional regulator
MAGDRIGPSSAEQRILETAREEFIAKGQNGARMQAIADRAGVNKALIHYYFRNKTLLYKAVLQTIIGGVGEALERDLSELDEHADVPTVIHALVATYVNALKASPGFQRLFLRELADGGGAIPSLVEMLLERFGHLGGILFGTLKRGVQEGRLRPIDPVHILINVMGMCAASFIFTPVISTLHRTVMRAELSFDDKFYAARITAITETALQGIMAGGER